MGAVDGETRPAGERRERTLAVRTLAIAVLLLTAVYLAWRVTSTIDLAVWWIALPLLAAELHNALGLGLYTFSLWDVTPRRPPHARSTHHPRVAVLIPTYNEPREVLLPVIASAVALEPDHETWVLDDGRRPWLRKLSRSLGAHYLTRPTNTDAKAGNLNHALTHVQADIIAVLDADHVAQADFLRRCLPYFEDPAVALVQTPQDFYNVESFEHEPLDGTTYFNEEAVFYRMIGPAKNRWQCAFWCGTNALLRVEALRSVGGVATGVVTEDILTSIRLHRRGWRTVYHNQVLAQGLAPTDAIEYMKQRHRWAVGAMQVLRRENPLIVPGLSLPQRLGYAATLYGWFDSWRTCLYLVLPLLVLLTGASPIAAPLHVGGPLILIVLAAQLTAHRVLARGYFPLRLSILFEVIRMPAVLAATFELLVPRTTTFAVTTKGRSEDGRPVVRAPWLLRGLLVASALSLAYFGLAALGIAPTHYQQIGVPALAAGIALVNLGFLWTALGRIQSARFAGERRRSVRFALEASVTLMGDGWAQAGIACDLSLTGGLVRLPRSSRAIPSRVWLVVGSADLPRIECTVQWIRPGPDESVEMAIEFADGQPEAMGRLAVWLFRSVSPTPIAGAQAA